MIFYRNIIRIQGEELANARNKNEITTILAKQLGYYPVFTWISSLNQLIDTLVTATTGQKAGLSTSPDNQIKQILEIAAIALRKVSADIEAQRLENSSDGKKPWWKTLFAKVEEKQEKNHKDDGTDDNSDLPIVIIDNYLFRETSVSSTLWDELAEWSAVLVENGIAHVVFVSANVGITKSLGKGELLYQGSELSKSHKLLTSSPIFSYAQQDIREHSFVGCSLGSIH